MTSEIKRFPMPKGSPVPTVTIRELFGVDEMEAANMVDALGAPDMGAYELVQAEKRESIRRSIVALGDTEVRPDIPLLSIDKWPRAPMKALERFYGAVNGLSRADINKAIEAGEWVWDEESHRRGCRFRFPERCSLESVMVWEITPHDELAAALRVDKLPPAGKAVTILRNRRELARAALGKEMERLDWDTLNLRTIMAITLFFDAVNGIPEEEISGCVAAAVDLSGAAPAETSKPPAPGVASATG